MKDKRPATIFCDIDGTLVKHSSSSIVASPDLEPEVIEGTIEKILEWEGKGYNIILVTGRKESLRRATEKQLEKAQIFYDKLIMGIGGGKRYLINDMKRNSTEEYAQAFNLERDAGISNIKI